jgi:peptidoglycan/xylan/chitin deacetylase (PgdA/CDA1 family)
MRLSTQIVMAAACSFVATACMKRQFNSDSAVKTISSNNVFGKDLPGNSFVLTFDDGPGERSLELAQYLAGEGISAVFFMQGSAAEGDLGTVKQIRDLGHTIANHTYSHANLYTCPQDPAQEVRSADKVLAPYIAPGKALFRAPYGNCDGAVAKILNDAGLKKYYGPIYWDVGGELTKTYSADWACWSPAAVRRSLNLNRALTVEECGDGYLAEMRDAGRGIVLAHDVHSRTVDMIKWLVPKAKAAGLRFVSIDASPNIAAGMAGAGGGNGGGGGDDTSGNQCTAANAEARIIASGEIPVRLPSGGSSSAKPFEPVCVKGKEGAEVLVYFPLPPTGDAYVSADNVRICNKSKLQACINGGGGETACIKRECTQSP